MTVIRSAIASGGLALAMIGAGPALAERVINGYSDNDLRSTNPGVDRDGRTDSIHLHVVEGLVAYGADLNVKPMLAESVEVSEDGLTYTFTLRRGVKFHNGEEMTSEHVLWSWNRYMDPETGWRCQSYFTEGGGAPVASVEAPDDYTVVYTLTMPTAGFLGNLARYDCGNTAVLHPDSVGPDGEWIGPVATGPFTFGTIAPGRYIDLVKFEDYSARDEPRDGYAGGKQVLVDRVRLHRLDDSTVRKTALLAGELDVTSLTSDDAEEVESAPGVVVHASPSGIWEAMLINVRDPLLSDVRIRQAIVHALDRDAIVEVTTGGRGESNTSVLPAFSGYYSDAQREALAYDPDRARALLAEAGYNGQQITLLVNRGGLGFDQSLVIQAMLGSVGINVQLEVMEWGTLLERYQTGNYELAVFAYSARLDPALSFEMITGDEPRKVFRNPEATALVQEAMVEGDPDRRQEIIDTLHRMFVEEAPAFSIAHTTRFFATRDRITDFYVWGNYYETYWGVDIAD